MINLDLGPGYLPAFITEELIPSAPMRPETGIHRFLFKLPLKLHPWRSEDWVDHIVRQYAAQCGWHVPESEITAAIQQSKPFAWTGQTHSHPSAFTAHPSAQIPVQAQVPEPQFDANAFASFIAGTDQIDADWLADRSPICPWNRTPASFLHALYTEGEKVIIFDDYHSQGQEVWEHPGLPYDARTLNSFAKGKRHGVWFLCNPVDGELHVNDAGKISRRSHQNITSWRYMVVESDQNDITANGWIAAISQLSLPVAAIYETGGRLPHALLRADASSKEDWDHVRDCLTPLLTMIGADISSLSAVRLTRLPCCERLGKEDNDGKYKKFADGPHLQRLLYLNLAPDGTSIAEQKA